MSARVAITGASGQLGRLVAEYVLAQCAPGDVILATRSPNALTDLAARGAEVRRADFDEPGSLHEALVGAERMLLISVYGFLFSLVAWMRKSLRPGMLAHAWHDALIGMLLRVLFK